MPQSLGTIISTAAALPIFYAIMVAHRRRLALPKAEPLTFIFIGLAGATHTLGTLMQFSALKIDYVSVVQPLVNLQTLFAVLFLLIVGTERVSRNLIIGSVLVVAGSILVVTR